MRCSAVIFDLDGTLVESLPGIASALNGGLEELGYATYSEAEVRRFIGDGAWMLCRRALPEQSELAVDALCDTFGKHYAGAWKTGTNLFDGIKEMLDAFTVAGVKMSVLSNKPHAFTKEIVAGLFPEYDFAVVLGQREGVVKKPDPAGTHECLERLGCSAQETYFIGDSTVDVETSHAAGTQSVAVPWGYHDETMLRGANPDHWCETVESLKEFIINNAN